MCVNVTTNIESFVLKFSIRFIFLSVLKGIQKLINIYLLINLWLYPRNLHNIIQQKGKKKKINKERRINSSYCGSLLGSMLVLADVIIGSYEWGFKGSSWPPRDLPHTSKTGVI